MKICFIGDARSIHLRRWIDHFSLQGNAVSVISYHEAELSNARIYTIRHEKNALLGPLMYPAETMQIAGWIRKIQPDLVHLHYVSIDGLAPALFKNIPLIASVWGSDILYDFRFNRKFRMVIGHILHRADRITATSRFLAEETQKYLNPGKEVHVVPFGVDTEFFRPSVPVTGNRNMTLCYIKGLESHYGPQILLSIMPQILEKYTGTILVMAGSGSRERDLRRLAEESGVSASVQFPGSLSSESVKKGYFHHAVPVQ
jgi:glycosyltransferase involved in cell wall biosynthesis